MEILEPPGWPRPQGYANGVAATGRLVFVAGQIGWDREGRFPPGGLVPQTRQALANCLAVLAAGGAGPEHVARMTWYVEDLDEYRAARREIGAVYRELMGAAYPAMSLVRAGLLEPEARVEIECTAVVPS